MRKFGRKTGRRVGSNDADLEVLHTFSSRLPKSFLSVTLPCRYEIAARADRRALHEEQGRSGLNGSRGTYRRGVCSIPVPESEWPAHAIDPQWCANLVGGRMYPPTLDGLDHGHDEELVAIGLAFDREIGPEQDIRDAANKPQGCDHCASTSGRADRAGDMTDLGKPEHHAAHCDPAQPPQAVPWQRKPAQLATPPRLPGC